MATTKLELTQLLAQRNEELNALRLRISILDGELALRPRATPAPVQEQVISYYCGRDGVVMHKRRVGTRTFTRPATQHEVAAQAAAH